MAPQLFRILVVAIIFSPTVTMYLLLAYLISIGREKNIQIGGQKNMAVTSNIILGKIGT